MARSSRSERTWSDIQLIEAVAASRSWRDVMRELGLCVTSAGSIRVVSRHVARLGLDTSHFTGQRAWSDAKLIQAASQARSWSALLTAMGVKSTSRAYRTRVKAHAVRLGPSGKGGALQRRPPLRTVLAGFLAHGSSKPLGQ